MLVQRMCTLHPDVSLSCGVAEYQPGDTGAQLMRRADLALYAAKEAGRGRCELGATGLGASSAHRADPVMTLV